MLFQQAYSHRKQVLQMNFLVGSLVLSGGERVVIVWSDGRRTEAVYQDTPALKLLCAYHTVDRGRFTAAGGGQGNPPLQPLYAAEGHPYSARGRASGRAVTAFRKIPRVLRAVCAV